VLILYLGSELLFNLLSVISVLLFDLFLISEWKEITMFQSIFILILCAIILDFLLVIKRLINYMSLVVQKMLLSLRSFV